MAFLSLAVGEAAAVRSKTEVCSSTERELWVALLWPGPQRRGPRKGTEATGSFTYRCGLKIADNFLHLLASF